MTITFKAMYKSILQRIVSDNIDKVHFAFDVK